MQFTSSTSVLLYLLATTQGKQIINLAKLDDGVDESPTVMVGDRKQNKKHNSVKIGAY